MKKLTMEFIKSEFEKEGYILISNEYINEKEHLKYICPNGHEHSIRWDNWNSGYRCPYCCGNARLSVVYVKKEFEKEGYILVTTEYINCSQKLEYICPNGHKYSISWDKWKQGCRCPYCAGNGKPTIEYIRNQFEEENYILLTNSYNNNRQRLKYICPNNHKHNIIWRNWVSGKRCPFCSGRVSKWEKEVRKVLNDIDIDYVANDRTQLCNPKTGCFLELDIWMPQLNKAIECNGIYWHSSEERKYCDKVKQQLCKEQGIDLLVITDSEWKDSKENCECIIESFLCDSGYSVTSQLT